jgi:hypothetical protein
MQIDSCMITPSPGKCLRRLLRQGALDERERTQVYNLLVEMEEAASGDGRHDYSDNLTWSQKLPLNHITSNADAELLLGVYAVICILWLVWIFVAAARKKLAKPVQAYMEYQKHTNEQIAVRDAIVNDSTIDDPIEGEDSFRDSKMCFVDRVAMEVVVKIGRRPTTPAGFAAAQTLAFRLMRKHNHRLEHIIRDLPLVMKSVCTPTEMERGMELFAATQTAYTRYSDDEMLSWREWATGQQGPGLVKR